MTEGQIEEFKKLEDEKRKLVIMQDSISGRISAINHEVFMKSKECNHQFADGEDATRKMHPFKSCLICGQVLL